MSVFSEDIVSLVDPPRHLSREESEAIGQRVLNMGTGGGSITMTLVSEWAGEVRWARNRTALASDRRSNFVSVRREIDGAIAWVETNQVDDESLLGAVRAAERILREKATATSDAPNPPATLTYPTPKIWSDATYGQTTDARAEAIAPLMRAAERAGVLSAGFASVGSRTEFLTGTDIGPAQYAAETRAQCSTTVRDKQGTGSGWAGTSSYDVSRIRPMMLGERAQQKCLASRNPVGIEPGRYTLIMEPQAVYELVKRLVVGGEFDRYNIERGGVSPWFDRVDAATGLVMTKLGQKVLDERITIEHDPSDPELGIVPFLYESITDEVQPYVPARWFERGVLSALAYRREYALRSLNQDQGLPQRASFRMSGGTTSVEEMIRSTRRGLLVTRFWNVRVLDSRSLLSTGLTRDGLWLIENGEISRPVRNLRFTESPLFALNSIDQLGVPEPVFAPDAPAIVPPMKVHDFSFTSLVDAI